MTTDEATKPEGEVQAAALAERGEDITPAQDRGVLKIIKRPGNDDESPMIGDKVYVHYKGKLANGKKFDSSRDRNEPFVFSLGKGQVIKAWDIGVATMKKGEVCYLLCKPEYAYGAAGSAPKIPSNATLFFEVELLDFKGEDLFEDGGIIRRIKRKGEGYSNPNEGATVESFELYRPQFTVPVPKTRAAAEIPHSSFCYNLSPPPPPSPPSSSPF